MKQEKRFGLEIDDDPQQQQWEWIVQQIAWVSLAALLVAVCLGLFGRGGPISNVEAMSEDGKVRIEYDRFMRFHSPDRLKITTESSTHILQIRMYNGYAEHIQIERIMPEPERESNSADAITYYFHSQPGEKSQVTFHFAPQKYGKLEGWIAVSDGPRQPVSQFVYP